MDRPRSHPPGDVGNAQDHPPVVKSFNQLPVLDAPPLGLLWIQSYHNPVIPFLTNPVPRDIGKPITVSIVVRMIRITGMGCDQLQRILLREGGVVSLPAGDVARHRGALLVPRRMFLEALGDKLDLPAI